MKIKLMVAKQSKFTEFRKLQIIYKEKEMNIFWELCSRATKANMSNSEKRSNRR